MNDHEYAQRVQKIKETILREVDKDIVVASQHDIEGAKKHLQPLVEKLRRLEVLQQKEMQLEPELQPILKNEIRLEEQLITYIVAFIKEEDQEKQEDLLEKMVQVLSLLKDLSAQEEKAVS